MKIGGAGRPRYRMPCGASSLTVELQLAHSEKDKIRAAYHKTSLRTALDERRELLQKYADYLDGLREKAKEE